MKAAWNNRLFKKLRTWLSGNKGMCSKHGVGLALDILEANGVRYIDVKDAHGFDLRLSTSDQAVSASVIRKGHYSREIMVSLVDSLRAQGRDPGDLLFVNVGANIGTTCLNAYQSGFRRIHAIEPDPDNFAILQHNLEQLNTAQIRLDNVAIGKEEDNLPLFRNPHNHGKHSLIASSDSALARGEVHYVPVKPLHRLIKGDQPFVLFADVEGYEPQVLEGGEKLILASASCQAMCLELTPALYDPEGRKSLERILSRFSRTYMDPEAGVQASVGSLIEKLAADATQFDAILLRDE